MNSFQINKIAGAGLGALLFVMAIGFIANAVYAPITGKGPGYTLPEPQPIAETAPGAAGTTPETAGETTVETPDVTIAEAEPGIELTLGALLASASADAGAKVAKKCKACHTFEEGGAKKIGPNLWEIVGREVAGAEGFGYSDALKALGGTWTFEALDGYVTSPKTYAPGNKMAFSGVSKPADRANLLAYLQSLASSPVPFPAE